MTDAPPTLDDLPDPPPGETGWPWTEQSEPVPEARGEKSRPLISVITPSYNQGNFIEETIRSVLLQGYPRLEYIVIDGGSDDGSIEVIRKYEKWIDYWVSEPDKGQSHAINKGFFRSTGEYVCWINSDDLLQRNALHRHARKIGFSKDVLYAGDCIYWNEEGEPLGPHRPKVETLEDLVRVGDVWREDGAIQQPATLFPLAAVRDVGGLDVTNHHAMDYEFWGRLMLAGLRIKRTHIDFGIFRRHDGQKIADHERITESLVKGAHSIIDAHPTWSLEKKERLYSHVENYWKAFNHDTGLLDRMGLPHAVKSFLRSFYT